MRPQTIVERLDFVAKRIPGLKFTPPTQLQLKPGDDQGYGCFMSCDMYYIEIKVDQSHQTVKDVVISHANNDGISCPYLRKVLADQDFETFAKHLSGLHSIYQITTNDKKVKQRAYPALTALETDLTILYDYQRRRTNNCYDLIHKSPIGIMEPRKGGLPVRLTFFTTPYDLVDMNSKEFINMNLNTIIEKKLGLSATVEIEGSSQHKLQVRSLISTQQNSSLPAYAPFISQNSEKLPAQFVLKLCQPLPMLNTSIQQIIHEMNEPITIKEYLSQLTANSKESLVSLIARQELDLNKGPFCRSIDLLKSSDNDIHDAKKHVYSIKLPDQHHTYHILDDYLERQDGVYVTKIPFTHPTSIPNILRVLRQQALLNFVVGSCIRRIKNTSSGNNNNNYDEDDIEKYPDDTNIFDVIPVNLTNISVSFEHPSRESLATLEIDIKDLCCQLYALDKECVCTNEFATKVFQKCWSIPVTLRSVLKKCNERRLALLEDANKRRERELQELLASTTSQQGMQYKSHLNLQEQVLQTKFQNVTDKSTRDLNSIAEFLTSKVTNNATTSDASNHSSKADSEEANRSNLLKKYSCKPKAKQNAATKNQSGNKILSLMLKRQNLSADEIKGPLVKKAKTKISIGETSAKMLNTGLTTKIISPEAINVMRNTNKTNKQSSLAGQNVSVSLIRSPSKIQPGAPSNGNNNLNKPRKSSIGAVLDSLVGGVTPEQNQFAIKQGSLGGLKLTVTKTKPATATSSSPTTTPTTSSTTLSNTTATTTSSTTGLSTTITSTNAQTANKFPGLGPSTTTTKYTIPKIPKTQQASQSNQTKNPVSSSTHPQGRTTSNPLAVASRPSSSTNNNENRKRLNNLNISNMPVQIQQQQLQQQLQQQQQQQQQQQSQQVPNPTPMFAMGLAQQPAPFVTTTPDINILAPNAVAPTLPRPFMSSSVDANLISSSRPQFLTNTMAQQQMQIAPIQSTMNANVCDSMQRLTTSVINGPPQFYMQQPVFEETSNPNPNSIMNTNTSTGTNTVSSTPKLRPEISQGVSSSSDPGPVISTPSSPTECSQVDTVAPPPLIPIDSLEEPQAALPDSDHPDDASDRLSIVDTNSNAGTPKQSSQDSPSGAPSSSSQVTGFSSSAESITGEQQQQQLATSEVIGDAPQTSIPSENQSEQSGSSAATTATAAEIPAITCDEISVPSSGPTQSSSSCNSSMSSSEDPIISQSTTAAAVASGVSAAAAATATTALAATTTSTSSTAPTSASTTITATASDTA